MTTPSRNVVKIAHMTVLKADAGQLVTHALGSCIGVTVYDPVVRVGGLLHFMLPMPRSADSPATLDAGPYPYASHAVPALFRAAYAIGADKSRLIVCAAGGAEMLDGGSGLRIGARNWTSLRKLLWKNNVTLHGSEIGGSVSRNLSLDLATGEVHVVTGSESNSVWRPAA